MARAHHENLEICERVMRVIKSSVYLETTIPGYLTSWPSRDLIVAGHQQITREWWEHRRDRFRLFISQFVIDEASGGDPIAARERMRAIQDLPLLDITAEVGMLASEILASGIMPRKAATDAAHIAVATVHGMDFVVTWNCVHLANGVIARAVSDICRRHDFECPVICTPEELFGD